MFLTGLKLVNFKNYADANVSFDQPINLVYGDNGSGKTNILDAIHFLSVSKSYFGMSDKYLIRNDEDFYRLEGKYTHNSKSDHLIIKYKRDRKRDIRLNLKKLDKLNDLIGRFPVVLVAPDDIKIVKGQSKDRRDYFNKWLCQANKSYLQSLLNYNRLLRQKDALLKGDYRPNPDAVRAYNFKMIPLADEIHEKVQKALEIFEEHSYTHYRNISNRKETISIDYQSDLNDKDAQECFDQMIQQEIFSKRPLVGIQRDEYEFQINGQPLKKYGSQGQIKSWLYAMRFAEFDFLQMNLNTKPILILDDFFEKLDRTRLSALLNLINSDTFGQVFLSDTELTRSKEIFEDRGIKFASFYVDNGTITTQ